MANTNIYLFLLKYWINTIIPKFTDFIYLVIFQSTIRLEKIIIICKLEDYFLPYFAWYN